MGQGLMRVAKITGGMILNGEKFVYDYANDECVPEAEMPFGSARHKASEIARARYFGKPELPSGRTNT